MRPPAIEDRQLKIDNLYKGDKCGFSPHIGRKFSCNYKLSTIEIADKRATALIRSPTVRLIMLKFAWSLSTNHKQMAQSAPGEFLRFEGIFVSMLPFFSTKCDA